MSRKHVPPSTNDQVLLQCRRRCCICYGLNQNTSLTSGQIAHLDKNSGNASLDNLAFLCLSHHDEYDSTTSQRKNFTIGEVKAFRAELMQALQQAFSRPVRFGASWSQPIDVYAGTYILLDEGAMSAEVVLTALKPRIGGGLRYQVTGFGVLDRNREMGAHTGEIDSIAEMTDGALLLQHGQKFEHPSYSTLTFPAEDQMQLTEVNVFGEYGWGVSFAGQYGRITAVSL